MRRSLIPGRLLSEASRLGFAVLVVDDCHIPELFGDVSEEFAGAAVALCEVSQRIVAVSSSVPQSLGDELVAHELGHATQHVYRLHAGSLSDEQLIAYEIDASDIGARLLGRPLSLQVPLNVAGYKRCLGMRMSDDEIIAESEARTALLLEG